MVPPSTSSRFAADLLRVLPRKRLSSTMGGLADLRAPRPLLDAVIQGYCRILDVDMREAEVPEGGFESFNAFFTRRLKPGARPIDDRPDVVVSPADGRVEDLGPIDQTSRLWVKGREYSVGELLGDTVRARTFNGGQFFLVYLSPRDYHRVHAPVSGPVRSLRHVGGTLYPVNRIGLEHVPNLFARNERVVIYQDSDRFGVVATIMVGAIGVGRISIRHEPRVMTNAGSAADRDFQYEAPGPEVSRGQELGTFHLGSTVLVMLPPGGADLGFEIEAGSHVRMGRAVMRGGA